MCRYAFEQYKNHFACLPCRFHAKHASYEEPLCPTCREPMLRMGMDFKAPRKRDEKQWKKLEILVRLGMLFNSCGCGGPGWRPKTLSEAKRLQKSKALTADERTKDLLKYGRRSRFHSGVV